MLGHLQLQENSLVIEVFSKASDQLVFAIPFAHLGVEEARRTLNRVLCHSRGQLRLIVQASQGWLCSVGITFVNASFFSGNQENVEAWLLVFSQPFLPLLVTDLYVAWLIGQNFLSSVQGGASVAIGSRSNQVIFSSLCWMQLLLLLLQCLLHWQNADTLWLLTRRCRWCIYHQAELLAFIATSLCGAAHYRCLASVRVLLRFATLEFTRARYGTASTPHYYVRIGVVVCWENTKGRYFFKLFFHPPSLNWEIW